jgi:hypothetical protein
LFVTSPWGIGLLALSGETMTDTLMVQNGQRIGGWLVQTKDNDFSIVADFDGDARLEVLVRSSWGIGLLGLYGGSSHVALAMAQNGSRIDGWVLSTKDNKFPVLGDFDGDKAGEALVTSPWGLAVLKFSAGAFQAIAMAQNGTRLGGWLLSTADNVFGMTRVSRARVVTVEQINEMLVAEEPDYEAIAWLGTAALPEIKKSVESEDVALVSKATYMASLVPGDEAVEIVSAAAKDPRLEVRVAAAASIRNLPATRAAQLLEAVAADADMTIRLKAVKSAIQMQDPEVLSALGKIAEQDPSPIVRRVAAQAKRRG